jgi:hypothetical protein
MHHAVGVTRVNLPVQPSETRKSEKIEVRGWLELRSKRTQYNLYTPRGAHSCQVGAPKRELAAFHLELDLVFHLDFPGDTNLHQAHLMYV